MKLRLAKDSIRFRLLRSEVNALASGSRLQETLTFSLAPTTSLTYGLQGYTAAKSASVTMKNNEMVVSLPADQTQQWAASDTVGIYVQIENGTAKPIQLIVEKDFACLDRDDAENADTYINPKMAC